MTDEENSKCHKIIHTAAAAAGAIGFGAAQLPGSDVIPITTIQIGMIVGLGAVFGIEITETAAKSILGGAVAAIGGRTASQFLVGWLPGIGNIINATTAASITEGLGWYVANDFDKDAQERKEAEKRKKELEHQEEETRKREQERREAEARRLERERQEADDRKREHERIKAEKRRIELERQEAEERRRKQERREAEKCRIEQERKEAEEREARKLNTKQLIMGAAASVLLAFFCSLDCLILSRLNVSSLLVHIISGVLIVIIVDAAIYSMSSKHVRELERINQIIFSSNFMAAVLNVAGSLIYLAYDVQAGELIKSLVADINLDLGKGKFIIDSITVLMNMPFLNLGLVLIVLCWLLFLVVRKYTARH